MEIAASYAFTQPSPNGALNPRYTFKPWQSSNSWFSCVGNCDVAWTISSQTCTNGTMYLLGPPGFGWAWQNSTSGEAATVEPTQTKAILKDMNKKWLDLKNESFEYLLQLGCDEGNYKSVNFTVHLNNWNYATGAKADQTSSTGSPATSTVVPSTPSATEPVHSPATSKSGVSAGAIAGIVIGTLALLGLLIAFLSLRHRRQKKHKTDRRCLPEVIENDMFSIPRASAISSPAKTELAATVVARDVSQGRIELAAPNRSPAQPVYENGDPDVSTS